MLKHIMPISLWWEPHHWKVNFYDNNNVIIVSVTIDNNLGIKSSYLHSMLIVCKTKQSLDELF